VVTFVARTDELLVEFLGDRAALTRAQSVNQAPPRDRRDENSF
jgi:hypothetical protein